MKKFALNNSYFKNRRPEDPDTLSEIVAYHKRNGELPFRYDGDNWPYDTVCERQKRCDIQHCQYLTPDAVASEMARLAKHYAGDATAAFDACCGTGQITKELTKCGFEVTGFDIDPSMIEVHNYLYPECNASIADFRKLTGEQWEIIVSNPPFDRAIAPGFIDWLVKSLTPCGRAVLLLPVGYVDKNKPKALAENLSRLKVLHRSAVTERFVHTNGNFEIVVVEKIK
jgi:predicted RNA methylase